MVEFQSKVVFQLSAGYIANNKFSQIVTLNSTDVFGIHYTQMITNLLIFELYSLARKIGVTFPHLSKRWNHKKKLNGIAGNIVFFT
jgi:hypothetical protein